MQEALASPWGVQWSWLLAELPWAVGGPVTRKPKVFIGLAGMELTSPQHPHSAGLCIGPSKGAGNSLY